MPPALSRVMEKKDPVSVEQPSHNNILSVDSGWTKSFSATER